MFAEGDLYLDDGDSLGTVETGSYSRVNFRANHSTKTGTGAMTAQVRLKNLNFHQPHSTFASNTAMGSGQIGASKITNICALPLLLFFG